MIISRVMRLLPVLCLLPLSALAQAPATPPADPLIRENATTKVAAHTYVIPDNSVGLVPNVGIIVGTRAVLVIDPGLGRRNGETVLREVGKLSRSAEVYVAATHFHAEHTTGWAAFPATAKYISPAMQEQEFAEGGAQQIQLFSGRSPMTAELLRGAGAPRVDIRFDREHVLDLGGVRVRFVVVGPTHTKGDTMMFVDGDNVLFAGDVIMNQSFLAANAASSMQAWLTAFDVAQRMAPTVIVPSHGPVGDGGLIAVNRDTMLAIQARAKALKAQGQAADAVATAVQAEQQTQHPGWPRLNGVGVLARSAYAEAR